LLGLFSKKYDFEQGDHNIQIVFEITAQDNRSGDIDTKAFNTGSWPVVGGKYKSRKAIEDTRRWVIGMIIVDYNKTLLDIRIPRIYIDDVKQIREDLPDEPMYGDQVEKLEFCGYNMNLKRFTIKTHVHCNIMLRCLTRKDGMVGH
jgi:hypothetical protein